MSTITSPRPTTPSLQTPTSSRRASTDTTTTTNAHSRTASPAPHATPHQRPRNRAALRDYYGLKSTSVAAASRSSTEATQQQGQRNEGGDEGDVKESELDKEGFDAEAYVQGVLGREGLEGLLRIEGRLIGEIRALDGERKALVYDNYSKLIAATDTIRKMRMNMDPLTPTTSTLSPAISHIAETAASLARSLQERRAALQDKGRSASSSADAKEKQRQLVRWVLGAPRRLKGLIEKGKWEEAEEQWKEVTQLLDKWKGVGGVDEVRRQCEQALAGGGASAEVQN